MAEFSKEIGVSDPRLGRRGAGRETASLEDGPLLVEPLSTELHSTQAFTDLLGQLADRAR